MMRLLRALTILAGLALVALSLAMALPSAPAQAQGLPPRPTAAPPTDTPDPGSDDGDSHESMAPGRITGTVIDQRSGAPAPGVAVRVGDELVTSDANGNYDRNGLAPGSYSVALELAPGQGEPAQGPQTVAVAAGQTLVQHLAFRSPEPATPAPAATEAPAPAPPQAPAAVIPAQLPNTGGADLPAALPALIGLALIGLGLGMRRAA